MGQFWGPLQPETVSVGAAPVGITGRPGGVGLKASAALIVVEDAAIRYFLGEIDPTASVGITVSPGGTIELTDWGQVRSFAAIAPGSAAKLQVQPFIQYG